MRSCASRGARSPGSARNRSSCSRAELCDNEETRACLDMRVSAAAGRHRPGGRWRGAWRERRFRRRDRRSKSWRRHRPKPGGRPAHRRRGRRSCGTSDPCRRCGASPACDRKGRGSARLRAFEKARRQTGQGIGHSRASVISWSAAEVSGSVGGHGGGAERRRGMPNDEGVDLRRPLSARNVRYCLSTRQAQQFAVAAAHQRQTTSHKANGPVAQVVGLPGSFGNAFGSEQTLGDRPITCALISGVERAKRQRQPLSALSGKLMESRASRTPIERAPEPARGMHANIEDIVERQFDGVRLADDRRLFQKEPVLDPAKAEKNMPTVRCSP